MRIGLFSDTYPPFINGVSTSLIMLKRALEKLGHTVYVVTVNNESSIKYNRDDPTVLRIPAIPVGIYDYRLSGPYPVKALKIIKEWNLDVIHSHTEFGIGTFARVVARKFKIPLVHTYHTQYDDYMKEVTHGYFNKEMDKLVQYFALFYCDKTATELIVPTKKTYDQFKEQYKVERTIHVIPTGLEVERFYIENANRDLIKSIRKEYKIDKNEFILMYLGRVAKEKSIDYIVEELPEIMNKYKNFRFMIVGAGPDEEEIKKLANKLGILDRIIFTGKVPYDDVPAYYHVASAFITASTSETQGLTTIESMAASCPTICINDNAFNKVIDNELDGFLFDNKKEMVKYIEDLITDKKLRETISKQGRLTADKYNSRNYALSVLNVYRYALKENKKQRKFFLFKWIDKMKENI